MKASFIMGLAIAYPSLNIKENGNDKTLYIIGPKWYTPKGGNTMDIPYGGRSYLSPSNENQGVFYSPNLLGGTIEYDVDLSQSGCSCNAALYLISMPAKDQSGTVIPGKGGDYYCDANMVGGNWCPEFDIMEANTHAWHTTPHKCDDPNDKGHYSNCDRSGDCNIKAWGSMSYGPGDKFMINTFKLFHIKTHWHSDGSFTQTFTQGKNTQSMGNSVGNCRDKSYMSKYKQNLADGMTIAVSSWGNKWDTMKWLDSDTGCKGDCISKPIVTIQNLVFTTGDHVKPSPAPTPKPAPTPQVPDPKYYYAGDNCAKSNDGECGDNCKDCVWSWPKTDQAIWNSKDAACRCKTYNTQ